MKRALSITLWLMTTLALSLSAPVACWARTAPWEIDNLPNSPAPAFSLPDLSGKQFSSDRIHGQVTLINFWATWCSPCREEMPALSRLYQKLKDKGLMVIGISIDSDQAMVKQFIGNAKTKFPILHDPEMKCHDAYKVYTYPTTFLVDRKGVIRKYWIGPQEWDSEEFGKILQEYLQ
jgi:peroxiredoxin